MKNKRTDKVTENTRTVGAAISTLLNQLPDRFTLGPHTAQMAEYIGRRWRATSYGFWARGKAIMYNPPFVPDERKYEIWRWVEHPADGLRFIGKAHEIRGSGDGNIPYFNRALVDHNGWYMDNYQDETICGEVYQLPARDGKSQYVPAIEGHNGNDGAILNFADTTDDLKQAIRVADQMAEWYAEDEREYQARESAKARIEDIDTEITESFNGLKALCREIRANCDKLAGLAEMKKLIKQHARAVRREVGKLRREKTKLQDNFWEAVPNGY